MTELKDLIGLLATIDLGILAAALTLLALYPAIAATADARGGGQTVSGLNRAETRRRSVFFRLAVAGCAASLGLLVSLGQASYGVLMVPHGTETAHAAATAVPQRMEGVRAFIAWLGVAATAFAILASAAAGWPIFRMAREEA